MLTKEDLKRKSFNLSELNKIPCIVFTPNTNTKLPSNLELLLYLLRQIQTRNFHEKFYLQKRLTELQQQESSEENEYETNAINVQLSQIEYSRHHIHTIYTQILLHLFHTKQLELLYLQSHESHPDTKNVLTVNYGGHTHRFQIKTALIQNIDLEYRGIRYKQDPPPITQITDEEIAAHGYTPIEVIRECRRISNYLTNRTKAIKEKNTKINTHNNVLGQIKKMVTDGEVTVIDDSKLPKSEIVKVKPEPKPKPKSKAKPKTELTKPKPQVIKSSFSHQSSSSTEQLAKKPIKVIRKRSFQLNK